MMKAEVKAEPLLIYKYFKMMDRNKMIHKNYTRKAYNSMKKVFKEAYGFLDNSFKATDFRWNEKKISAKARPAIPRKEFLNINER